VIVEGDDRQVSIDAALAIEPETASNTTRLKPTKVLRQHALQHVQPILATHADHPARTSIKERAATSQRGVLHFHAAVAGGNQANGLTTVGPRQVLHLTLGRKDPCPALPCSGRLRHGAGATLRLASGVLGV
jgi:hypothetical protein